MCGALADAFRSSIDGCPVALAPDPPDVEIRRWRSMTVTNYGSRVATSRAEQEEVLRIQMN